MARHGRDVDLSGNPFPVGGTSGGLPKRVVSYSAQRDAPSPNAVAYVLGAFNTLPGGGTWTATPFNGGSVTPVIASASGSEIGPFVVPERHYGRLVSISVSILEPFVNSLVNTAAAMGMLLANNPAISGSSPPASRLPGWEWIPIWPNPTATGGMTSFLFPASVDLVPLTNIVPWFYNSDSATSHNVRCNAFVWIWPFEAQDEDQALGSN